MVTALRWGDAPWVPLDAALEHPAPRSASLARGRMRTSPLGPMQGIVLLALAAAAFMLLVTSTDAFGATLVTPKCNGVNLRTGPATTYTRKGQVDTGARLTVVAKVSGGSYSAQCAGTQSGSAWYKVSAINGKSVKSLYGVTYVYGARQLFKTVINPTPSPTNPEAPATLAPPPAPSSAPTDAPPSAPTDAPRAAPTAAAPTTAPTAAPTT